MSWLDRAACKDHTDLNWFPTTLAGFAECRAVCAVCPVSGECLEDALRDEHGAGVRAGYTPSARIRLRPGSRRKVAVCGTDSGYYDHLRRTFTPTCQPCRDAHTKATKLRAYG